MQLHQIYAPHNACVKPNPAVVMCPKLMKTLVLNVCPNCAFSCQHYRSNTGSTSIAPLIDIQESSVHDAMRQKDPSLLNVCYDCGVSLHHDPPQSSPLPLCLPELPEILSETPALVDMRTMQAQLIQMRQQLKTAHSTIVKLTQKVRRIKRLFEQQEVPKTRRSFEQQ
jgi:hypothetical protein